MKTGHCPQTFGRHCINRKTRTFRLFTTFIHQNQPQQKRRKERNENKNAQIECHGRPLKKVQMSYTQTHGMY